MVSDGVVLLLSVFYLPIAFSLPVLREAPELAREVRSGQDSPQYPPDASSILRQWDPMPSEEDFNANYMRVRHDAKRARNYLDDPVRPHRDAHHDAHHAHRRTMEYQVVKRNEEPNIPTMGLGKRSSPYDQFVGVGVLSDLRKFFTDLRVNLDSVEEAAALSQEQGNLKSIDPADFLAFLARHGARSGEATSGEIGMPRNPTHMRRLMFGYNHDDQPYVNTGLGK